MKPPVILWSTLLLGLLVQENGAAFCGFYVARADTKLFNQASQVVMVRDADRTVLTMANDFKGDVNEFAVVIPVPTILEREQIHVTDRAVVAHLDAYSAPRLVEYFDPDPCQIMYRLESAPTMSAMEDSGAARQKRAKSLGVTIEASYTVGEYDILILSAKQSGGLITWLKENKYRVPDGAESVVGSYLKQGMRFFVAKVNLDEQAKLGFTYLRPIQIAYESPKFMLPIRLGTVNADGPQELYVYTLTRNGRVETTNYRTVKLPTGMDLPAFVKDEFAEFYRHMFTKQTKKEDMRAVFLEYAWDMGWCDPCAADPLSNKELRELGVFWLEPGKSQPPNRIRPMPVQNVFVTRLHLRYDRQHFPEDLFFQQTADRSNFQGRYVLRHPWEGERRCPAAERYLSEELPKRRQQEARNLANLTGWDYSDIQQKMPDLPKNPPQEKPWWKSLWKD